MNDSNAISVARIDLSERGWLSTNTGTSLALAQDCTLTMETEGLIRYGQDLLDRDGLRVAVYARLMLALIYALSVDRDQ